MSVVCDLGRVEGEKVGGEVEGEVRWERGEGEERGRAGVRGSSG